MRRVLRHSRSDALSGADVGIMDFPVDDMPKVIAQTSHDSPSLHSHNFGIVIADAVFNGLPLHITRVIADTRTSASPLDTRPSIRRVYRVAPGLFGRRRALRPIKEYRGHTDEK